MVRRGTRSTIETRTVEHIPLTERHGKARDLFTIWFGTGLTLAATATGFLTTTIYGLPLWAATVTMLVGCLVGGIVMALHAAQGPQTGVPQMLQTRAQFGSYGSLLVIVLVVLMYVGFFASNLVLGGQSIAAVLHVPDVPAIVLIGAVSTLAAVVGYSFIHRFAGLMSIVAGIGIALALVWALVVNGVPHGIWTAGSVTSFGVMGTLSLAALWLIACAPFVSDYTRYMPKDTGVRPAFYATYWGAIFGAILPMFLGALIGAAVPDLGAVDGLTHVTRGVSVLVIVVISLALISQSAMYVYCGSLSMITVGQTLFAAWVPRAASRIIAAVSVFVVALLAAIAGAGDFLTNYTNFLQILLCVLIPWTAINLVDYYVIKHGHYDIASMFEQDGGRYGRFNGPAIVSYFVGIAIQVPFLSTALYTGPIATALGGVDVSWIVGLAVICPFYYVLMRVFDGTTTDAEAVHEPTARAALAEMALDDTDR
jgi:purine-cytosine permease-like protein